MNISRSYARAVCGIVVFAAVAMLAAGCGAPVRPTSAWDTSFVVIPTEEPSTSPTDSSLFPSGDGWGQPVDGMQIRLTDVRIAPADGPASDQVVRMTFDARNVGKRNMDLVVDMDDVEVLLNDRLFRADPKTPGGDWVRSGVRVHEFSPEAKLQGINIMAGQFRWTSDSLPLRLAEGGNSLRLMVRATPSLPDTGEEVRLISNQIEPAKVAAESKAEAESLPIRMYDIRDLIYRTPNFVGICDDFNGPTLIYTAPIVLFPAKTSPRLSAPADAGLTVRIQMVRRMIATIQDRVSPDSWSPEGGPGVMREMHGMLVVTQTPKAHKEIVAIINQLRRDRAQLTAVQARFIEVPANADEKMWKWLQAQDKGQKDSKAPCVFLDDAQVGRFLDRATQDDETKLMTASRLTLHKGQWDAVNVGVDDIMDLWDRGDQPVHVGFYDGASFKVSATASADGKSVTMNLRTAVSHMGAKTRPQRYEFAQMAATIRLPDKAAVVYRMQAQRFQPFDLKKLADDNDRATYTVAPKPIQAWPPGRCIYLLVTPTILPPERVEDDVFHDDNEIPAPATEP